MNRIEKDMIAIEKSITKYLNKDYYIMEMLCNIEMLANSTFDNEETQDFYNFLMELIGDVEGEYFMRTDFPTTNLAINYDSNMIALVRVYLDKFQKYKK